ncbi:FAM40A protein [Loa loa]|uniref:FAM40A protein n=2 Tax=Loa loa TaxID=7209 RepID=A0A1S0TWI9_LOALO|nr:FAM40A protein [Loa loa]EFO21343.2 FAM40A protein [Loa loa]
MEMRNKVYANIVSLTKVHPKEEEECGISHNLNEPIGSMNTQESEKPELLRRVRPNFADDVYGSRALKLNNEHVEHVKNDIIENRTDICESALAQRRSAQLPKLKKITNKPRPLSNDFSTRGEMNDFEFVYSDCDTHAAELAELYTYSELEDWALNMRAYRDFVESRKLGHKWSELMENQQKDVLLSLLEELERVEPNIRLNAARSILYILQGTYMDFVDERDIIIDGSFKGHNEGEVDNDLGIGHCEEKCLTLGVLNAYKAYEVGTYQALCKLLLTETQDIWDGGPVGAGQYSRSSSVSNSRSASNADLSESVVERRNNRRSATMADNEALRVTLSALYHMVESIRRSDLFELVVPADKKSRYASLKKDFIAEIEEVIEDADMSLIMVLLEMMPAFCHGSSPHFPMKKVLLLVWKILLAILGGWKELREGKAAKRAAANLSSIEDTLLVASAMKSSSINGNDSEQNQGIVRPKRTLHPSARLICRQFACTASNSLEDKDDGELDKMGSEYAEIDQMPIDLGLPNNSATIDANDLTDLVVEELPQTPAPVFVTEEIPHMRSRLDRPNPLMRSSYTGDHTPVASTPPPMDILFRTSLPWNSKVRDEDIETFLQCERMKFFNYRLSNDSRTVFGLPLPIQKSIEALRRHVYVSLGELQANREKELNRYMFSQREDNIPMTSAEKLYRMMLPNLSQYIIALLKVLLAAAPSSKAKSEAINILSDVLTPETDNNEILSNSLNFDSSLSNMLEQSVRIAIDVNRHKEIMVKASSAILILLMKHFRLNHIYQFEYIGQHLVFANCIPLILKFMDQNMVRYIQSKHELPPYNYPHAPLYYVRNHEEWPVLDINNLEDSDSQSPSYYLWRNVFSAINLLRVLNKLTKWKHARTMMLVVFKSAPILKRSLRVKLAVFQLYVLKLLKMQARYLGRQWRRTNMEIMSAIYTKVRHRLNDDWAYANETRSKSWDFQNEEAALKTAVERFNSRRYARLYSAFALEVGESSAPGDSYLDNVDMNEFEPMNNSFQSLLGTKVELSDRFKRNYVRWVDDEVIKNHTNWDLLMALTRGIIDFI